MELPGHQLPGVRSAMVKPPVRAVVGRGPTRVGLCSDHVHMHWNAVAQARGATNHLVQPMANTSFFASDVERFQRVSPTKLGADAKELRLKRMYNRAFKSRQAQQRIQDTYEREQRARDEAERRRVASKSKQQLRYMIATLGVQPRTDPGFCVLTDSILG